MAVTRQAAPSAVTDLIQGTLDSLDGGAKLLVQSFREMSEPLPLYTVDVERLLSRPRPREGSLAELMVQIGWRSVITTPDGEPSLADVKSLNDELRFARVVSGERVSAMIDAAAACEELGDSANYELRIVESPSLKIAAIWLAGEASLFMPFAGLPQSPVPEAEFIRELVDRVGGNRQPFGFGGLLGVGLAIATFSAVAAVMRGLVGGEGATRKPVATIGDDDDE